MAMIIPKVEELVSEDHKYRAILKGSVVSRQTPKWRGPAESVLERKLENIQ